MIKNKTVAALLSCCLIAACADEKNTEKKPLKSEIWAATDARDAENSIFAQALEAQNWYALEYLGQIGGEGCKKLAAYLKVHDTEIRTPVLKGAAYCYGEAVTSQLIEQIGSAEDTAEKNKFLTALAFSSDPSVTGILVENFDTKNAASVYALMQKITYDGLSAADLGAIPFASVLEETASAETGFVNAYFLARLQGLPEVYALEDFASTLKAVENQHTRKLLVRGVPQFGDAAAGILLDIATGEKGPAQIEAIRSMGRLGDMETKNYLLELLEQPEVSVRQLAIAAFAGRNREDDAITYQIEQAANDPDEAVAATALESLSARAPDYAVQEGKRLLKSESYYLANKAISVLARHDAGKAVLARFAEENAGTQRGLDASVVLEPSTQNRSTARATPPAETLEVYRGKSLKLHTTRGAITIEMFDETPYAAVSFLQLAESGKMDGMTWHRVIPNFVAQAGQSEDMSLNDWGTIREEWFASDHQIGTVGVATVGKDTGSTQFFINTAYNLHLNGRYTVFGRVTEGLEAAIALREGDLIEKAEVLAAK